MDTKKTSIYLKDLLSLGYKKTSITKLVNQAEALRDIPRQHGYAIPYTYNQAFLICIGCELFNLGLSFRHVDIILYQLMNENFRYGHTVSDVLFVTGAEIESPKIADIKARAAERKVKTAPLSAVVMSIERFKQIVGYIGSFVHVDMKKIFQEVDYLFS